MKLSFEKRDVKVRPDLVRAEGKIPAVFYGRKEASTPVSVQTAEFKKIWKEAGESTVITLSDGGEEHDALIHSVDIHPVTDEPRHVDFYVIEKGKKLRVAVPIELEGIAPAVKELSGTLVRVLHEIEVEAMPKDLPQHLTVDISSLVDFSSNISVSDVKVPNGVTIITSQEEIVATVSAPREEAAEPEQTVDLSSIEVAKKGKEKNPDETPEA